MKTLLVTAAALAVSLGAAVAGDSPAPVQTFLDKASTPAGGAASPSAVAVRTGTIKAVFTVTIVSKVPTTDTIICGLTVNHVNPMPTNNPLLGTANYAEMAQSPAKRSGNTATCTVLVPYSWALAETTGQVYYQASVTAGVRQLYHTPPGFALPANGATTQLNLALRF